jgi:hypothetical protein
MHCAAPLTQFLFWDKYRIVVIKEPIALRRASGGETQPGAPLDADRRMRFQIKSLHKGLRATLAIAAALAALALACPASAASADIRSVYRGAASDLSQFAWEMEPMLPPNVDPRQCMFLDPSQKFSFKSLQTGCWVKKQVGIFKFTGEVVEHSSRPMLTGGESVVPFDPKAAPDYLISQALETKLTHTKYVIVNGLPEPEMKVWWQEIMVCGNYSGATQWNAVDVRWDYGSAREWIHGEGGATSCRHYGFYWSVLEKDARFHFDVQEVEILRPYPYRENRIVGEEWQIKQ